ncbi:MAG: DUF4838 domain-containing protein [Bacteroidales bacterium]|nr:DUF4838 domain-containing protein [Bacteroidales bacterium]MCF8458360.1 DUF4838 domain-containing protein [Bacteroidales bacterium]
MKYLIICLISLSILSCTSKKNGLVIVENGRTEYKILIAPNTDSLTQKAASELRYYFHEISDCELEVTTEMNDVGRFIKIGSQIIDDSLVLGKLSGLKRDGFILKTSGKNLLIAGMNSRGNILGVYALLEEYLGCMKFPYGEEHIPKSASIEIPKIDKLYNPSFSYRHIYLHDKTDSKLIDWYRIENLDEWGMYVHTFQKLVPPDLYFEEHPDYFSLVNNRRIKDGQLCLSNPEVIQLLKDNLRKEIAKKPGFKYWSVSQNDCINYCECEACNKLYEKYGNISGAYIEMANAIAAEFPDKQISTLAYQFTRSAPRNIQPLDNVNIMFCSIECNRSMPLVDDPRSADFVQEMKDWSTLTDNIYMWDYVVQFENYLCPFPNFSTLQSNIRFFNEHRVDMIFEQGSNTNWSDMKDLKLYLLSKLAWDVKANVDSLTNRFFDVYYGEAQKPIRAYFDLVHQRLKEKQEEQNLNIYGFPVDYVNSFLKPEYLIEYKALMDSAEILGQKDSVLLKRVWRARMAIDFAYIDIALNHNSTILTFFKNEDGHKKLDPVMLNYLDRMVEIGEQCDIRNVNEKNLTLVDYRKYVLRNLSWILKDNLAKLAKINILTKYSEKYQLFLI